MASIADFMRGARAEIESGAALDDVQGAIGERLADLSRRDDLTRYGAPIGPTDASTGGYLLWREPPHFTLIMIELTEHYRSPVHEHGEHWIVACGYRGADRWDLYRRLDDSPEPGACTVEQVSETTLRPGDVAVMPPPPGAIHGHNNVYAGSTLELIFSAVPPVRAADRLLYDVVEQTCAPSWYEVSDQLAGARFP